jgi:hypothetical protein
MLDSLKAALTATAILGGVAVGLITTGLLVIVTGDTLQTAISPFAGVFGAIVVGLLGIFLTLFFVYELLRRIT